ncbi:hypothetical protein B9Z55_028031 [Caenorhabditis nigoni]|uniref:Uncharacterized protein n=1 Tax=Caenorhabditis nigoni TaxID=1611254 RepID=A0A2G5SDD9_9PELO|nr:hypothetical protein B9Z55_028031 [Caenorhabditis nigoni]
MYLSVPDSPAAIVPSSTTTAPPAHPGTSAPLSTPERNAPNNASKLRIPSASSNGISAHSPPVTVQATGQDDESSSSSSSTSVIRHPTNTEREQLMKAYWKTSTINELELKFNKTSFLRFAKEAEDVIFADLFKSFSDYTHGINKLENERSIFEKNLAEAKSSFAQSDQEVRDMRERCFGEASLQISYAEQRLDLDKYTKWFKVAEKVEKVIENASTELKKIQEKLETASVIWNKAEKEMNESQMELKKLTTIENVVRDEMKKLRDGEVAVMYGPHGMKKHIMKFKALVKKLLMMEPDGKYSEEEEAIIKESLKDTQFTIATLLVPIKESQKRTWIEEWYDKSPEANKPKTEENAD